MATIAEIFAAVESGKSKVVKVLVQEALDQGVDAGEILQKGMIDAMGVVGDKFKRNEIFVPEMLVAARAMKAGVGLLRPHLVNSDVASAGTVVIGTVAGDLHDIGKNLVCMMIEGAGFEVVDLGVDVPAEKFVEAIKEHKPVIIGLSALLTTTMPAMKEAMDTIVGSGLRDTVKVMVGGAPITQAFADEIGADGYSEDAASAAELAKKLAGK